MILIGIPVAPSLDWKMICFFDHNPNGRGLVITFRIYSDYGLEMSVEILVIMAREMSSL